MPPFIRIDKLVRIYTPQGSEPVQSLRGVDLEIDAGEYVAVAGANGSGKTTLARHIKVLLLPGSGQVWVEGHDTQDPAATRAIRSTVGIVFQSPADQIVATVVEEDVAFGPENIGVPEAVVAAIITLAVVSAWLGIRRGRRGANLDE